jgi:hypothetical protein
MSETATSVKPKKAEPMMTTVTMEDGRIVDFVGAKKKLLKTTTITPEGVVQVRLDFINGASRLFTIPAEDMARFAGHGAEQKLGDEIAGLEDVEDCVIAVDELIDRLYNHEWGVKREANGLAGTSILLRALVELSGGKQSVEQVKKFLAGKSQQEKMALRLNTKVKPIVDRLEAEKAAKATKVDTDALLAQFETAAA